MPGQMIDVHGGDFGVRKLELAGTGATRWVKMGAARSAPRYVLNRDIASFSVVASESKAGARAALVGGAVAGAVGVVAGLIAGKKTLVTFSCSFKDGKQILASADPVTAGLFELGARASASATRSEVPVSAQVARRDRRGDC